MSQRRAFSVAVYARRGGVNGEVLVIRHRRLKTWLPIGGELEAGETPLEAAVRELREETGMSAAFPALAGALDGVPVGLIGYEEHPAGSKGLHMNFVFVADVAADAEVVPNEEFGEWRWVDRLALAGLDSPLNVRQFGYLALDAEVAAHDHEALVLDE
ncbi:MAG: NUDIX domain-containing protein [Deltaproteobacteria bacterium]|nr:NUDIX domain-containing protein [Deltaproteobacteria bacterium]